MVDIKISIKSGFSTENCKYLFLNDEFGDFYFVFKENGVKKRLPCHKAILASSSKVFRTMFMTRWNQKNEEEIEDVSYDIFVEFLQFFYLPDVTLSKGNLNFVVYLAHKYEVKRCLKVCEQFLIQQSTLKEVCSELDLALKFGLDGLKERCLKTISDATKTVVASEQFLSCSKDALKCILELNTANCEELDLFDACLKWTKYACERKGMDSTDIENRKSVLGDCWYAIRFGAMKKEHIGDCVKKYPGLFNPNEMGDLFSTIASDEYSMKIFKNTTPRLKPAPLCFREFHEKGLYDDSDDEYAISHGELGRIANYTLTQSGIDLITKKLSLHSIEGRLTCSTCSAIISDYKLKRDLGFPKVGKNRRYPFFQHNNY